MGRLRDRTGAASAQPADGASTGAEGGIQAKPCPETTGPKATPPATAAATPPAPSVVATAAAATLSARDPDLAYGAFQRGFYLTAFAIATRRVEEKNDIKAMTLLGELYANGFGVERNDTKAAEWYKLAADRGDREAMFALGMFHLGGRAGTVKAEDGHQASRGCGKARPCCGLI